MTLIELLVALVIVGVLATLAAPSFQSLIVSANISSAVNTFMSDMRYARSEAVRRGVAVVICRSDAPEAAAPTCSTSSSSAGTGWEGGWIVFQDTDGSNTRNAGDIMLRVQSAIKNIDSITDTGAGTVKFAFNALGRQKTLRNGTTFQFGSTIPITSQRIVCVQWTGRVRVAGDGYSDCGSAF